MSGKTPSSGTTFDANSILGIGGTATATGAIIRIPTNNIAQMMAPPFNLSAAQASVLAADPEFQGGYTLTYTKNGLPYSPNVWSGKTLQIAMEQLATKLNTIKGAPGIGTALFNGLSRTMNIPSPGQKDYSSAWSALATAAQGYQSFEAIPANQIFHAPAGATAKSIGSVSAAELGVYQNEINNYGTLANTNAQTQAAIAQYNTQKSLGVYETMLGATTSQKYSAYDSVMNVLDSWGMAGPQTQQLVNQLVNGDGMIHPTEVLNAIRGTPEYQAAFPGLAERNAKLGPGGEHMTETQYQAYVSQVQNILGQYGIPKTLVPKAEIGAMVANNVSPVEFEGRITKGYLAYKNAPVGVRQLLQREYGMGPNLGAAYFLNPSTALDTMQRDIAQAQIQNYAAEVGLRHFDQKDSADLFSRMRLSGVTNSTGALANPYSTYTMAQAQNDLLSAAKNEPLTVSNPGASQPSVTEKQLIGSQIAGFQGSNQQADQLAVERAAQGRTAPFEGGGGYQENAKGISGLGGART